MQEPAGLKESALKKPMGRSPKKAEGGQAAIPTVSDIKKARGGRPKSVNPLIGKEHSMVIVTSDVTPTQHTQDSSISVLPPTVILEEKYKNIDILAENLRLSEYRLGYPGSQNRKRVSQELPGPTQNNQATSSSRWTQIWLGMPQKIEHQLLDDTGRDHWNLEKKQDPIQETEGPN